MEYQTGNEVKKVTAQVMSNLYNKVIPVPAIIHPGKNGEEDEVILMHNGLKDMMLSIMKCYANKSPISVTFNPIETSTGHCIVDCTVGIRGYEVTETGEATISTLNTDVAKCYPYLEAQKRAYDRAVISFLQLQVDGKRVYSDHEVMAE